MPLTYASFCSGIGAPEVAWTALGWQCVAASEIDLYARTVYQHHFPKVPLYGDLTKIRTLGRPVDVFVAGTPCQGFSIAGKRRGLDDPRGNLTLEFLALVGRDKPTWVVWENVPGTLSAFSGSEQTQSEILAGGHTGGEYTEADEDRDFAAVLAAFSELGYGFAYRILDAQYFGVPQRRRRIILVAHIGGAWQRCAAVLFEPDGLRGDPAPRGEAGERVAAPVASSAPGGSGYRNDADTTDNLIAGSIHGNGGADENDAADGRLVVGAVSSKWAKGSGGPAGDEAYNLVPVAFHSKASASQSMNPDEVAPALDASKSDGVAIAFTAKDYGGDAAEDIAPTLRAGEFDESHANAGVMPAIASAAAVRRLTPLECERLQGFPDRHTAVRFKYHTKKCPARKTDDMIVGACSCRGTSEPMADGPRYMMIGNSMAVPVMRWVGARLEFVHRNVPWGEE